MPNQTMCTYTKIVCLKTRVTASAMRSCGIRSRRALRLSRTIVRMFRSITSASDRIVLVFRVRPDLARRGH